MIAQQHKPGWYPHPAFASWATPFEEKYVMVDMLMLGDKAYAKNKIKKQEGRRCMFCKKSDPETSFRNAAHLVSRMMGNTNLYSTVECDACNHRFSLFETDLASFLGLARSITGLGDNKKAPGFPGIGVEAKSIYFKGRKLLVIYKEEAVQNAQESMTSFNYGKPTYTPAHVHKLFLKCALSVLPQQEVTNDYELALNYLQGTRVLQQADLDLFRFPLTVNMPLHIYIFKKKDDAEKLPVYMVSFYFGSVVASLPVLLHRDDLRYTGQNIELPMPPPYFLAGNDLQEINPIFHRYNLSSPVPLKAEAEEMSWQFKKEDLVNVAKLDIKTGEVTQSAYDPAGSKYFIATESGTSFTKEELIELMKIIEEKFAN